MDHSWVVIQLFKANKLPFTQDYLIGLQKSNVAEVGGPVMKEIKSCSFMHNLGI